jgi:hypothetical protein
MLGTLSKRDTASNESNATGVAGRPGLLEQNGVTGR